MVNIFTIDTGITMIKCTIVYLTLFFNYSWEQQAKTKIKFKTDMFEDVRLIAEDHEQEFAVETTIHVQPIDPQKSTGKMQFDKSKFCI